MVNRKNLIQINDLRVAYVRTGLFALEGIDLSIFGGKCTVIIGPNGSGKSTIFRALMGDPEVEIRSGEIGCLVDGQKIRMPLAPSKKVLTLSQRGSIFTQLSVRENLSLFQSGYPGGDNGRIYREFPDLKKHMNDLPEMLSAGQKRQLALARLFATDAPAFYLLDEPTEMLDSENQQKVRERVSELKARGKGICIISHRQEWVHDLADSIVTLEAGRMIRGKENRWEDEEANLA